MIDFYVKDGKAHFSRLPQFTTREFIIHLLKTEGKMNLTEIANIVGVSIPTIIYHVNRLETWGKVTSEYCPGTKGAFRIIELKGVSV